MMHFTLDAFQGCRSRLDEIRLIYELLEDLPVELGLRPAMQPFILPYYHGVESDDCGISAFVLLPGGHLTIHTFSYREVFFLDLLSAKDFDYRQLLDQVQKMLPASRVESQVMRRAPLDIVSALDPARDFGPHLFMDIEGYRGPQGLDEICAVFDALPEKIGMTPIMRPYCLKSRSEARAPVVSAVTMIAESHIALHVYPTEQRAFFDIFSCRFFDVNMVLPVLLNTFLGDTVKHSLMSRGRNYSILRTNRENQASAARLWLVARPDPTGER